MVEEQQEHHILRNPSETTNSVDGSLLTLPPPDNSGPDPPFTFVGSLGDTDRGDEDDGSITTGPSLQGDATDDQSFEEGDHGSLPSLPEPQELKPRHHSQRKRQLTDSTMVVSNQTSRGSPGGGGGFFDIITDDKKDDNSLLDDDGDDDPEAPKDPPHHEHKPPPSPTTYGRGILDDYRKTVGTHWCEEMTNVKGFKTVAVTLFLFFACIAPAITFGAIYAKLTHNYIGAVEMLVATAGCGIAFALVGGQPVVRVS